MSYAGFGAGRRPVIVVDAGQRGGDVALEVALRIRDRDPEHVRLTRSAPGTMPPLDRLTAAREAGATTFVSLEAGGPAGAAVSVHRDASIASRLLGGRLAEALAQALGGPVVRPLEAPLTLLDPRYHAEDTVAALVHLGELSGDRTTRVADALARTLAGEMPAARPRTAAWFDIWHEVPLVQQHTGMSCWAAAAAMIVGWRGCFDIDAEGVALGSGWHQAYRDGLEPREVADFARAWGLVVARPPEISVPSLRRILDEHGPLWVGEASPGLHVIVVAGMYGDGTPQNTFVRVADPWPIGRGERYTIRFDEFARNLRAAAVLSGGLPQFLHAPPGPRCAGIVRN